MDMTGLAAASITDHLEFLREAIDRGLEESMRFEEGCPPGLAEAMRYCLLAPGKRFRPTLVLLAVEHCGAQFECAMPAACAVEMIHTYSLVHDDLPAMDDDDFRRGRPSCHKQFGEANAILTGDALIPRAFEVIAQGIRPSEVANKCVAVLARAAGASALVGGQFDDLDAERKPGNVEQLKQIHRRKTGALITTSLELGAICAMATDEMTQSLRQFGENIGLAFQIVDDLLDLSGQQVKIGKTPGKDQAAGKLTYPALLGIEESRRQASRLIANACASIGGEPTAEIEPVMPGSLNSDGSHPPADAATGNLNRGTMSLLYIAQRLLERSR
jgi:geranylgeranyl diphosphate synthase, type II